MPKTPKVVPIQEQKYRLIPRDLAFKITSCSFIIRSASRAGMLTWLASTLLSFSRPGLDRTTSVLFTPDN